MAVDLRRRRSSRPLGEGEDRIEESRDIEDGEFEALLLGLDVRDALHSLSAKHREILELHFDDDLSQPQVSERLDIPLGTVKTRTYYGLKALKLELEERGILG